MTCQSYTAGHSEKVVFLEVSLLTNILLIEKFDVNRSYRYRTFSINKTITGVYFINKNENKIKDRFFSSSSIL